jgi:hypothetical protein
MPLLDRLVLGDLGGVLVERDGLTAREHQLIDRMNENWTGLKRDHLVRCAERASNGRSRGVILFARGREKAFVVHEIITRGWCNVIVASFELAGAVAALPVPADHRCETSTHRMPPRGPGRSDAHGMSTRGNSRTRDR